MLKSLFTRFRNDTNGLALIEFAIAAPVLLLMLFGSVELARYALYRDKLESAAMQIMDALNQNNTVSLTGLQGMRDVALPELIAPFSNSSPTMVVTFVMKPVLGGVKCKKVARWQWRAGSSASKVANGKNSIANIGSTPMSDTGGDFVMAVEIYATYEPMLDMALVTKWMDTGGRNYAVSYGRPRFNQFDGVDPNNGRTVTPTCRPDV